MRLPSFRVNTVRMQGEDAAAYRDKVRHRDRIVLRVVAALIIIGQMSRLFFDLSAWPGDVYAGIPHRLSGILCFAVLFALAFHRVTISHLHAVVGVGYLLATILLLAGYAAAPGPAPPANTAIGIGIIVFGAFSFGLRLALLIGALAVTIALVHMPLAGLDAIGLTPRLIGTAMVGAITLSGSWLLDQHWRRAFLMERDLTRSHENLQRAHRELANAHATLKATQDQLVKAEKTAALGRLVAGLAHRINAPVGIQVSLSSHLADTTEQFARTVSDGGIRRSDLTRFIGTVRDSAALFLENARRTAHLVDAFKQLEASAGKTATIVDIGDLLNRNRPLIEAMLPPRIGLAVDAPAGLTVLGAPSLLDTILYQTVGNALRHAFPNACAGTVTMRAGRDADGGVVLSIADNGCGIPPEHLEHVFDPFYTDGAVGGSEGLGLAIVHNAVVGPLGGRIAIESREGLGTTVTVRLPAAAPVPEDQRHAPERIQFG